MGVDGSEMSAPECSHLQVAQPFSKLAMEKGWKHSCNTVLMSHPASINPCSLSCLLTHPSVTNSHEHSVENIIQIFKHNNFCLFFFPKTQAPPNSERDFTSLFKFAFAFSLCYSAWALWQVIISFWEKSHSQRAWLSSCSTSSFKKGKERIINRG